MLSAQVLPPGSLFPLICAPISSARLFPSSCSITSVPIHINRHRVDKANKPLTCSVFGTLWEVNALKISAIGTDLVGTSFQCHPSGTDFQCVLFGALIFSTIFFDTDFQYPDMAGTDFQYPEFFWR